VNRKRQIIPADCTPIKVFLGANLRFSARSLTWKQIQIKLRNYYSNDRFYMVIREAQGFCGQSSWTLRLATRSCLTRQSNASNRGCGTLTHRSKPICSLHLATFTQNATLATSLGNDLNKFANPGHGARDFNRCVAARGANRVAWAIFQRRLHEHA